MKWSTQRITLIGMMLSLAFVLEIVSSQVPLFQMPQGGSITLATIPIILAGYYDHWKTGVIVAFLFSFLQGLISPFYIVHPVQFLLDYPLAFSVLGLATIFVKPRYKETNDWKALSFLEIGIILVMAARLGFHVLSGVIFFGEGRVGFDLWWFSLLYNSPYMIATTVVMLIVIPIFIKLVQKK